MAIDPSPNVPSKARFVFVDGLRGIAALAVVVYHLYSKNLVPMTGYELPEPLHSIFTNANLGVHVFFVISGFVIAQSIRSESITPGFIGRFALRRSVRLDPPYWATIVAMIAMTIVSNHLQHDRALPIPSVGNVLAHLVYLQSYLGFPQIVGVFWTLCFEIQFYLVLVTLVGAGQWLARKTKQLDLRWVFFLPLWAVSLSCVAGYLDVPSAVFVYGWPFFFLGVVVNWEHQREIGSVWFAGIVLGSLVILPFATLPMAVAASTALVIHLVSRVGCLETLTLGRVVQYLGKISYSLYLVHMLVGTPLMRLGIRLLGKHLDLLHTVVLLVMGLVVSIVAAHVLYVLIERPAMRLSHRLRNVGRADRPT